VDLQLFMTLLEPVVISLIEQSNKATLQ